MYNRGVQSGFPKVYTVVDVETTGSRSLFDRVIDIGIIRVEDGKITKTFQTLINPGIPIPGWITNITGISSEEVLRAPSFEDVALTIEEYFEDAVFVAHNASFDYGFIKNEFRRLGIQFRKSILCSVKLSRILFPHERHHNLDAIMARHNIACDKRHRAYPDAQAVVEFLTKLEKTVSKKKIIQSVATLMNPTLPGKDKNALTHLPDTPGIYYFYGKEHELLYIGKSKNIKTRARSHFSPSNKVREPLIQDETYYVEVKETSGELSALLLESEKIKSDLPLYNRALRRRRELTIARESLNEKGYKSLRLEKKVLLAIDEDITAIFRSLSNARASLRVLSTEFGLCHKLLDLEKGNGVCFLYGLEKCSGACLGHEDPKIYNERFTKAFEKRRLLSWPYSGGVIVREEESANSGTVFFIDMWHIIRSYTYQEDMRTEFIHTETFDYDIYKILVSYLRNPKNRKSITVLPKDKFKKVLREVSGEYERVIT